MKFSGCDPGTSKKLRQLRTRVRNEVLMRVDQQLAAELDGPCRSSLFDGQVAGAKR